MRARKENGSISVHAIAGTQVVALGLDATKAAARRLVGFAIRRRDHQRNRSIWLKGRRGPRPGQFADSNKAPIQAFLWGDYTAVPGRKYTYTVHPMYGDVDALRNGKGVQVTVTTESPDDGKHAVFFNRGVAGSQSYSRQFQSYRRWYLFARYGREKWREFIRPEDVPDDRAWKWLSRGLVKALLGFIGKARGPRYALRAAVYEFDYRPAIQAFVDALESGADVKIIYDAKGKDANRAGTWQSTEAALRRIGLRRRESIKPFEQMMIPRQNTTISHNKFVILLEDGVPKQVWIGSTNFTAGGIFGQSNVGHIIRDEAVAAKYLEYWKKLATDPRRKHVDRDAEMMGMCNWTVWQQPDLKGAPSPNSVTPIFSPRLTEDMLDWYAERLAAAKQSVHFTAAFGVCQQIGEKLVRNRRTPRASPYLRYIMLESIPSKSASKKRKQRARNAGRTVPLDFYDFVKVQRNCIAAGAALERPRSKLVREHLLEESLSGLDTHVEFLHTKYMILDPLTDDPVVITGSANFSRASTVLNDENMLIIRGNTRVADIFLGEFMRLFKHFQGRNRLNRMTEKEAREALNPRMDDSWTTDYYKPGTQEYAERLLFR